MHKRNKNILQSLLIAYFTLYLIFVLNHMNFLSSIISPISSLTVTILMFHAARNSDKNRIFLAIDSFACLSLTFTDLIWGIMEYILKNNPSESVLLMFLYIIPNILIAFSTGMYLMKRVNKLNIVQLVFDLIVTTLVALSLVWILFFKYQFDMLMQMNMRSITAYLSILCDLFSLIIIFILFISLRRGTAPKILIFLSLGMLLYTISDFLYAKQLFQNNVPSFLYNGAIILSILLLGSGSLWIEDMKHFPSKDFTSYAPDNLGSSKKILLLLFAPVLVLIINGPDLNGILFLSAIIAIHQVLSVYVQSTIRNEHLLKQEKKYERYP